MKKGSYLSIDLDTKLLEIYYSTSSPNGAYSKLTKFLIKNGWEHKKDSNYVSVEMSKYTAVYNIRNFAKENKWFPLCVTKVDIAEVSKPLSVLKEIKEEYTDEEYKRNKEKEYSEYITGKENPGTKKVSLDEKIEDAEDRLISQINYDWLVQESLDSGMTLKEFLNELLDNNRENLSKKSPDKHIKKLSKTKTQKERDR